MNITGGKMSSLWRKFRSGSSSSTTSSNSTSSTSITTNTSPGGVIHKNTNITSSSSSSPQKSVPPASLTPELLTHASGHSPTLTRPLITKADEELFLCGDERKNPDPLEVRAQLVKSVLDILHSPSTLPYFIQFLQGCGADKYARFWLEANSFCAAVIARGATQTPTRTTALTDTPGTGRGPKERESQSHPNTHSREPQRDLVLPDLVSNIQYASDVTPLSSPEGVTPDALTCHTPRQERRCDADPDAGDDRSDSTSGTFTAHTDEQTDPDDINPDTRQSTHKVQRSIADDALTIFQKYLSKNAEFPLGVEEEICEDIRRRISVREEDIDPGCFLLAQEAVIGIMEREYLPKFLSSDYYLKHQIDILTSGSVRLADIIYSDSAFPYFMEYVEQEGGQGMLQFWVAMSNFRQQLLEADPETHDPGQAQADAMILYDKYFSLQATCPQGFSDAVRFLIEGNICQERGPQPSCFDVPLRIVLHVLERDFLPGYLSSSLHISYLGELINTVKSSVELFGRKKRTGSESTCSSEQSSNSVSITTHNTLLAMDSSTHSYRVKNLTDPSAMRIDASQLNDPDSLWRRKNFTRLSCGFVNELGRFEAEIEAHPFHRQQTSGLQKIRRLMGREEDKVKEEMAYKVAEMIIKGVTQVTLGPKGQEVSGPLPLPPHS